MGKTILRSPVFTAVLFVVAAVLLLGGTVGAVQAAPRTQSNDLGAQMQLSSVSVAVVENGSVVEGDALMGDLLERAGDKNLKIGKEYSDRVYVQNTGTDDEYIRATVRTYWTDESGKVVDVDPKLIKLNYVESGWSKDEASSSPERTVLYYGSTVAPSDLVAIFDKVSIDPAVMTAVTKSTEGEDYDYEGLQFHVEVTADAVQSHNGDKAMTSAWGRTN